MLMALGEFVFKLKTAAFSSLRKTNVYRWSSTDLIGNLPSLQALGKGAEKIDLEGVVYDNPGALNELQNLAEQQKPQLMVNGSGSIHGRWVITQIDETQGYKENDIIDWVCWKNYGFTSGAVETVLTVNPEIAEYDDYLPEGLMIDLPETDKTRQRKQLKPWD